MTCLFIITDTHETSVYWSALGICEANHFDSGTRTMSAPAHGAPEASGSRAFTPRTETSINSNDSESTAIRKTVRKWYDAAKMPTIYHRKSFGSFGNIEPLHPTNTPRPSEAPPTSPPRHQEAKDMDTNAVGWDHEGDPQNPMNWSKWRKGAHFLVVFLICFVS